MKTDEALTAQVLDWFRGLDNGAGSNVQREHLRHLVLSLQLASVIPYDSNTRVRKDDFSRMRAALETILDIGPRWIENGRKAVDAAEGQIPADIIDSYVDANADLCSLVESTRNLLLKGRLRYHPVRKPNMNGFWHNDAEHFGSLAVTILNNRRNRKSGLASPTSPAIRIVQHSLYHLYREHFTETAIVKAIKDKLKKDKTHKEIVRSRAARLRSIVLPDAAEYPGTRGLDDAPDD